MASIGSFNYAERQEERAIVRDGEQTVPRNTYNAVLGGTLLLGVLMNVASCVFLTKFVASINPLVLLIGYVVIAFGSVYVMNKTKSAAVSFVGFIAMSLATGLVVTYVVQYYELGSVLDAFLVTTVIVAVMAVAATLKPDFFLKIGPVALLALLAIVVVEVVMMLFLHIHQTWIDYLVIVVFCGLIGFDWVMSQRYAPTVSNAIRSAADIYLDLVNIFLRVLSIMGKRK